MKKVLLLISIFALWNFVHAVVPPETESHAVSVNSVRIQYFATRTSTAVKWTLSNAHLIPATLDNTKPTVMYFHDHQESVNSESCQTILDAYFELSEFNVLILDWEQLAAESEYESARNTIRVSPFIGQALLDMYDTKLITLNQLTLVGHGMGAHIAGNVGHVVRTRSDNQKRVYRITGLDPAFYPFYPSLFRHMRKEDALFVDVIHTDAWGAGAPVSTGTVDFWPNNGRSRQPGCSADNYGARDGDSCSHRRSWRYWAESVAVGIVRSRNVFQSVKCSSWLSFTFNRCYHETAHANMGLGASFNIKGNYYLLTNTRSSFSRGNAGTIYESSYFSFIGIKNSAFEFAGSLVGIQSDENDIKFRSNNVK